MLFYIICVYIKSKVILFVEFLLLFTLGVLIFAGTNFREFVFREMFLIQLFVFGLFIFVLFAKFAAKINTREN